MDEILLLQLKDIDIRNIFHKRNSTLLEDRVSGCRLYVGCRASIKFLIFLLTRERGGEGRFCCSSLSLTGGTKVRRNENYIETKFQARLSLSLFLSLARSRSSPSPLALQVSCYVFFDYTAYLDTISNRLSLRINLSPPPSQRFPKASSYKTSS